MGTPTRRELLQAALQHVRRTGDTSLPWERMPALSAEFDDLGDLLSTLHQRWHARFAARLDMVFEESPADLAAAVGDLWGQLAAEDPAWRAVLDAYREHPAVLAADERQRRLLAAATAGEVTELPSDRARPVAPAA